MLTHLAFYHAVSISHTCSKTIQPPAVPIPTYRIGNRCGHNVLAHSFDWHAHCSIKGMDTTRYTPSPMGPPFIAGQDRGSDVLSILFTNLVYYVCIFTLSVLIFG